MQFQNRKWDLYLVSLLCFILSISIVIAGYIPITLSLLPSSLFLLGLQIIFFASWLVIFLYLANVKAIPVTAILISILFICQAINYDNILTLIPWYFYIALCITFIALIARANPVKKSFLAAFQISRFWQLIYCIYILLNLFIYAPAALYNFLFILPCIAYILLFLFSNRIFNLSEIHKSSYWIVILSYIVILSTDYIILDNFFHEMFIFLALLFILLVKKRITKKYSYYIMNFITYIFISIFILKIISTFEDKVDLIISIISILSSILIFFFTVLIKWRPGSLSGILHNFFSSEYSIQEIKFEITEELNDNDFNLLKYHIDYVNYCRKNNINIRGKIGLITKFEISDDESSRFLNMKTIYLRFFASFIIITCYLITNYRLLNSYIVNKIYTIHPNIAYSIEMPLVLSYYADEKIKLLLEKKDVADPKSYFADYYRRKALNDINEKEYKNALHDINFSLYFRFDKVGQHQRHLIYIDLDEYNLALQDINDLIGEYSDPEYYYDRSYLYYLLCDYQSAFSDISKALAKDPTNNEYLAWKGACYIGLGNPKLAIQILTEVINNDVDVKNAPRFRAIAYLNIINENKVEYLQLAKADIDCAFQNDENIGTYLARARYWIYSNEYQLAYADLLSAEMLDNKFGKTYYWFSKYSEAIGDQQKSIDYLRKARMLGYLGNGEY